MQLKFKDNINLLRKIKISKFWLLIFFTITVIPVFLKWINSFSSIPLKNTIKILESDHTRGPKEAKVVFVEYSDFQCPACAFYHPYVVNLQREFEGRVLFVYRNFPIVSIHKNAQIAAQAVEAAGKQNKFWEMQDILFENQKVWVDQDDPQNIFIEYAKSLNLDLDKFEIDLRSDEVKSKIDGDIKSGNQLNVDATPTFSLNGKKLDNIRSYNDFKKAIEKALSNIK